MLESIKTALRVRSNDPEILGEIQDSIDAAIRELERVGIVVDDADPLIRSAIKNFCKSDFGYDNPEADRFMESFESMRNDMALSGDYRE